MTPGASTPRVGRPRATPQQAGAPAPREQILDAAAALFAENGYAGTSTRAIAERVGIRQASLYHHFAGKDELLLELLETSVRPSLAFVEALLAHPGPAAALHALAVIDVGTLLATPHNVGTLYLTHEVQLPGFDSFRAHRAELQAAYVALAGGVVGGGSGGGGPAFLGACCMQLVEMVIGLRRDGRPDPSVADDIAAACLRVVGVLPDALAEAVADGERLLAELSRAGAGPRTGAAQVDHV